MRASSCIIAGLVNASARKIASGFVSCTLAISHSQKLIGLVCGLSTRKHGDAVVDPEPHDPQHLVVDAVRVVVEVHRDRCPGTSSAGSRRTRCEPSGRVVNHSGCAVTHGWSGAHCSARSSATSRPRSLAADTNSSKSSMVPSSGWTRRDRRTVEPIAQGEPDVARIGINGAARLGGCVAALAIHLADRVDRWQVDDVEVHRRGPVELRNGVVERAVPQRQCRPRRSRRPTSVGRTRTRSRTRRACGPPRLGTGREAVISSRIGSAVSTGQSSADSAGPMRSRSSGSRPAPPRSRPRSPRRSAAPVARAMRVSSMAPVARSLAISSRALAGGRLRLDGVPPGAERVAPRLDLERPQPLAVRHDDGRVPGAPGGLALHQDQRGRGLGRRICGPAAAAGAFVAGAGGLHATLAATASWPSRKTVARDGDVLADDRLGRIFAEGDDGGYLVESDASSHAAQTYR